MIDERTRHELYATLEERLGAQEADTLMELLPPVGWADVATRHDLVALEERIGLRFDLVDQRFAAMDQRFDSVNQRIDSMEHRFATKDDLAAFATKTDLDRPAIADVQWSVCLTVTAMCARVIIRHPGPS